MKGEGLIVLYKKMKPLNPDLNKSYKFLESEPAEAIKSFGIHKRVSKSMERRMKTLTDSQVYGKNLVKAINTRVIPVARYVLSARNFTKINTLMS